MSLQESIPGFVTLSDTDAVATQRAKFLEERQRERDGLITVIEDSKPLQDTVNDADFTSDLALCKEYLQGSTVGIPPQDESGDSPSEREKILVYIKSQSYHVSPKTISKATNCNLNTVYSEVRRLCSDHEVSRDDDHRYFASFIAGQGGASVPDTARLDGIYTGLNFSKIQHLASGGPRYQNIRVVSGELDSSHCLPPLSIDVPYGSDVIHLDVSYGARYSRFNWSAGVSGGIHMDDYGLFCDYVSHVLSSSSLYIPRDIFYEDLTEAKWYTRQLEVFSDDFAPHHISGYHDIDTLRGVVCKIYGKADCVRRENQVKRLPDDITIPDLSVAVRGSASQIDTNVRVKQLEAQSQSIHDSQAWLIQQVNDMRRDMDAVIRSNEAVLEALKNG